ncbi:MAG TPA: two-component regulator propeller domain-containing protein [Verrucomicrobiae bacterium]|jgi:signal transduction histidine kinase/ligand-binding sensor domain-containing protein|nr:two-component regulator propeller domain-containing protein [Verrucomicrobiae bacterium]
MILVRPAKAILPWVVWLLSMCASLPLLGAVEGQRYRQRVWQGQDGLPSPIVRTTVFGRDGRLWLGTAEGLARYDGTSFRTFNTGVGNRDRRYIALCQTTDGSIWTSTTNGLACLKNGQTTLFTTNNGLPSDAVYTVYQDRQGTIWVGSENGLSKFDNGKFIRLTSKDGFIDAAVRAILEDRNGALWVGTAQGLVSCKDGRTTLHKSANAYRNAVHCLCQTHDGSVWAGTSAGLDRLQNGAWTLYTETNSALAHRVVCALYEDADGTLWVGTYAGAQRFFEGAFETVMTEGETALDFGNTVPGYVFSICGDTNGGIWLGTFDGLHLLTQEPFRFYRTEDGLPARQANSVWASASGDVWMGTLGGGLAQLHDGFFITRGVSKGLPKNIRALCESRDGSLWIGSDGDGVTRWQDGHVTQRLTTNDLPEMPDNVVRVIYEDHTGTLWFGGANNLASYKNGVFEPLAEPLRVVRCITEDRMGHLWVGSSSGLSRVEGGRAVRVGQAEGVTVVNCICPDGPDAIWLGADNGRLFRLKDGQFSPLPTAGLINRALQVVCDQHHKTWVSADSGIFYFDEAAMNDFADRKVSADGVFLHRLEGFPRAQCTGLAQPAGMLDNGGHLWFPTFAGVVEIDTAQVRKEPAPAVFIEEAFAGGEKIPDSARRLLPSAASQVEFDFTALNLREPGGSIFESKLEGLDDHWEKLGAQRSVRYNNLPPGDYHFRVRASTDGASWSDEESSFSFALEPHFYQRIWFYLLCWVGVLGLGWLMYRWAYRWRQRALRQRDQEVFQLVDEWTKSLQIEVAERKQAERALQESQQVIMRQERLAAVGQLAAGVAHEFNNILTVIQGHTCLLLDNPNLDEDSVKSLRQISEGVDRTAKLINQMLAFSRKQVIQLAPLDLNATISQVTDILSRTLGEHIALRLNIAPRLPLVSADQGMIQQIIVNLAVNARDAIGSSGSLTISAQAVSFSSADVSGKNDRRAGDFVDITISDTGKGMDQATIEHLFEPFFTTKDIGKGSGLGLATVYGMVNQHHGWIEVESRPGHGAAFHIFVPVAARSQSASSKLETTELPDGRKPSASHTATATTT